MADEQTQRDRRVKVFLLERLMYEASQRLREAYNGLSRLQSDSDLSMMPYEDGKVMFSSPEDAISEVSEFQTQILESGRVKAKTSILPLGNRLSMKELQYSLEDVAGEVEGILDEIEEEKKEAKKVTLRAELDKITI